MKVFSLYLTGRGRLQPTDPRHLVHVLSAILLALALGNLLQPQVYATTSDDSTRRPNIVFIMADDLGYGDLGCFGQKQIQTPNIDRLAHGGMRLTDFYAGSTVCAPSRCVLMTGYHTGHAFIRGNGKDNLRPEDLTVAEILQKAGYATCLTGKWGLGHEGSTGVPNRQGFDYFFGYLDQHHAHNYYPTFLLRNEERVHLDNVVPQEGKFGQGVATKKVDYSHDLITDEALAFIDRAVGQPFFLYVPWTIPHANNEAGKRGMEVPDLGPYAGKDWPLAQKAHAAMITRMDRDMGRILAALEKNQLTEETLIIFTSDNGPHREGGNNPDFPDSNGPLRGIKRALTEGGIRVPTIAYWPQRIEAGATTNHVGCFQDVMPTLAELAGVSQEVPEDSDGISFLPTLLGRDQDQRQHAFLYWAFYEGRGGRAARMGKWKAVQQPLHTPLRLYDLSNDLGEEKDLAPAEAGLVDELTALMDHAYAPSERWKFPQPRKPK